MYIKVHDNNSEIILTINQKELGILTQALQDQEGGSCELEKMYDQLLVLYNKILGNTK